MGIRNDGKRFEQVIYAKLRAAESKLPLIVHRFYDTHSAGNVLPAQPGDFLVIYRGVSALLELKGSCVNRSFRACFSSAVPGSQVGSHQLWQRAGAKCWFLFNFTGENKEQIYELWPSEVCIAARRDSKPLRLSDRYGVYSSADELIEDLLETMHR